MRVPIKIYHQTLYWVGLALASCSTPDPEPPITTAPPTAIAEFDLLTQYQESFPKYILESDSLGGLCIEILRQVERESGLKIGASTREFTPFKRLQKHLITGEIDVFFGMKKNAARERQLFFLEPPLYQVNSVIAQRADDPMEISSLEDLYGQTVLVPHGTATAIKLRREHPKIDVDAGGDIFICLKKLLRERGRFIVYHDIGLIGAVAAMDLQDQVRIIPYSFDDYYQYAVVSRDLDPAKRNRLQQAIKNLAESGALTKTNKRYKQL